MSRGIVDVKLDLQHKLNHGLHSSYAGKDFELRENGCYCHLQANGCG